MADQAPLYDLVLVISTTVEDDRRAKILSDVEAQISSGGGTIARNDDWHTRPLAYEIRHQSEGEYHLLQLNGPPELLENLSHSLRIDDAVLRFRIIKVVPGTPPPPDVPRRSCPRPASDPSARIGAIGVSGPIGMSGLSGPSERPPRRRSRADPAAAPDNCDETATAWAESVSGLQRFRPFSAEGADCRLTRS